jgi:hypothetical protein
VQEEDDFEVVSSNDVYAKDSNIETLLKELKPDPIINFTYANENEFPLTQPLSLATNERIQCLLTPLSFLDRNGNIYRNKVNVSIEYLNLPQDFLRNGLNTQDRNKHLIKFDFAIRLIFTDNKGYRLDLVEEGMEVTMVSEGDFLSNEVYSLDDPSSYPIYWKVHPLKEKMNVQSRTISENGETLFAYDFIMKNNQWIAFGSPSDYEEIMELCLETDMGLNVRDKTMAYGIVPTDGIQVLQFSADTNENYFCNNNYPSNATVKLVLCSMDNYVEYFYHESILRDNADNYLEIMQESSSLQDMLSRLSAI